MTLNLKRLSLTETVHTSWLEERLRLRLMAELAHIGGQVLKSAGKIRSCRISFTRSTLQEVLFIVMNYSLFLSP